MYRYAGARVFCFVTSLGQRVNSTKLRGVATIATWWIRPQNAALCVSERPHSPCIGGHRPRFYKIAATIDFHVYGCVTPGPRLRWRSSQSFIYFKISFSFQIFIDRKLSNLNRNYLFKIHAIMTLIILESMIKFCIETLLFVLLS